MSNNLLKWKLFSILIALFAGLVLLIPVNTIESFESPYQVPVLKEYQIPIQVEKNKMRYSATFKVEETYDIVFLREHPKEWVTGSFVADEPIALSLHDIKNYINSTQNIKPVFTQWSTQAYAEEFTFEPPLPPEDYYYLIITPDKPTKVSIKLIVHWYETVYETRYKTEYETNYKTEYKIIKKPLYNILLS